MIVSLNLCFVGQNTHLYVCMFTYYHDRDRDYERDREYDCYCDFDCDRDYDCDRDCDRCFASRHLRICPLAVRRAPASYVYAKVYA